MPASRKTVEIDSLIQYANGFLSARGGTKESRYGVICLLEIALNRANRYRGFLYLGENEVANDDLPGIRWENYEQDRSARFENTDPTRRRYA